MDSVDGKHVALGNRKLLEELKVEPGDLWDQSEELRKDGQTVMYVVVDGAVAGLVGVADPVKQSTPEAIQMLHEDGIRIVMLTGDNRTTAEAVAKKLGIDEIQAEVLPEQKGEVVKRLQAEGRMVAMAGDGVNDAPALALAHVGIAMGTGTDVAMESAGVTLVKGDLRGIAKARHLSRGTMRNIRAESFLCVHLQRAGNSHRSRCALSVLRHVAKPGDRQCRHDLQLGLRNHQRAEAEQITTLACERL